MTDLNFNGVRMGAGINILDLPGGAGCGSVDGGLAYQPDLWPSSGPGSAFACAWDTGRAATLQQPIETMTYYTRATLKFGDHQLSAEVTGSDAHSRKIFSSNQYTANNTSLPIAYREAEKLLRVMGGQRVPDDWQVNEAPHFAVNNVSTSSVFYHRWLRAVPCRP